MLLKCRTTEVSAGIRMYSSAQNYSWRWKREKPLLTSAKYLSQIYRYSTLQYCWRPLKIWFIMRSSKNVADVDRMSFTMDSSRLSWMSETLKMYSIQISRRSAKLLPFLCVHNYWPYTSSKKGLLIHLWKTKQSIKQLSRQLMYFYSTWKIKFGSHNRYFTLSLSSATLWLSFKNIELWKPKPCNNLEHRVIISAVCLRRETPSTGCIQMLGALEKLAKHLADVLNGLIGQGVGQGLCIDLKAA